MMSMIFWKAITIHERFSLKKNLENVTKLKTINKKNKKLIEGRFLAKNVKINLTWKLENIEIFGNAVVNDII